MSPNREEYIADCKAVSQKYFHDHHLIVNYIRERHSKLGKTVAISEVQLQAVRTFLNITGGNIPTIPSLRILNNILPPDEAFQMETKSQEAVAVRAFNSVQKNWLSRRSPIKGVVVTFRTGNGNPDVNAGWSLRKHGDDFNRYIGIRKAIKNSKPVRLVEKILKEPTPTWQEGAEGKEGVLLPHTVRGTLSGLIERAARVYQGSKIAKQAENSMS